MPPRPKAQNETPRAATALGQLTLVEHALCPLDAGQSLRENAVFTTGYFFVDRSKHYRKAAVTVTCPAGLSSGDEFYLWGLLALTCAEPEPDGEFHATPHHCLRRLGLVDERTNRGGRQYQQFAAALDRLAQVSYASDAFYDPVRGEHRRVRFGFLSYSLPLDPDSSRAWRVAWNPLFFDLVRPLGGQFRFDLATYRSLDPAARRLFLLVSKIFQRRAQTPRFDVGHLAVDVLGFAPTLAPRHQRQKLQRVVAALAAVGVVGGPAVFERAPDRSVSIVLARGPRFSAPPAEVVRPEADSPLWDGLQGLGFDSAAARRLLADTPPRILREWVDITLAARERFGAGFFKRSPQAYLVDNVRESVASGRTAPDWWRDLRTRESGRPRLPAADGSPGSRLDRGVDHSGEVLRRVTEAVFPSADRPTDSPASLVRRLR
jgi:hypothetical protein